MSIEGVIGKVKICASIRIVLAISMISADILYLQCVIHWPCSRLETKFRPPQSHQKLLIDIISIFLLKFNLSTETAKVPKHFWGQNSKCQ